jgi:hypothetical protein
MKTLRYCVTKTILPTKENVNAQVILNLGIKFKDESIG